MSSATVPIMLLLVSALCCVSAARQPLMVLDPAAVGTATLATQEVVTATVTEAVPAAAAVTTDAAVVPQEVLIAPLQPITTDISTAAVSGAQLVTPSAGILPAADSSVQLPAEDALVTAQQAATTTAPVAYTGNTLGIGFSGSGFLIMYHVGVTAYLRSLGIINSNTKFAGASGGSVAAAFSCSKATGAQSTFRSSVAALNVACRLTFSCRGTLDATLRTSLLGVLPANVASDCTNRVWVAVTNATANPASDTRAFVTVDAASSGFLNASAQRARLSESLAASSYIPRFSGPSSVTRPGANIGAPVAYDGVGTDPLPVLPASSGVTYTITVSAIRNTTDPTGPPTTFFDSLVNDANTTPDLTACPTGGLSLPCYSPLNPVKQPQPATVDIYPGRSGTLVYSAATWNNFLLNTPSPTQSKALYDQGRADARAYATAAFAGTFTPTQLTNAFTATAVSALLPW